jgi:methyl-accepting chemotaxis protein
VETPVTARAADKGETAADAPDGGVAPEIAKASSQLQQVRGVLADAVVKITTSFATLRKESDAQREMMDSLMSTMTSKSQVIEGGRHLSVQAFARETGAILHKFTDTLAAVSEESVRTVQRIDEMAGQFDAVFKLVEQVNDISHATFILAVNASIQAATAKGEHGHSFAVIASNVRDLSKKTQQFNNEIGDQIEKARGTISDARKSMSQLASRDLTVALESQQRVEEMLADVTSFETFTKETLERANGAAIHIAAAASQAVTALQFEDIVEQILGNVQARIERLGRAGVGARTAEGAGEPMLRDPVHQTSVASGDVELF